MRHAACSMQHAACGVRTAELDAHAQQRTRTIAHTHAHAAAVGQRELCLEFVLSDLQVFCGVE